MKTSQAPKLLRESHDGGVLFLTLNRPQSLNAIDLELADALFDAFDAAERDPGVRAIVVCGAGERAFSAGFDITEMEGFDAPAMMAAFVKRDPLMLRIATHPKPIIAAISGVCYGAGALIAMAADMRVGCSNTRFKITAIRYGGANATWSLPGIVGAAKAKEILMTGREVDAAEALEIGLLNQRVAPSELIESALSLARTIAANPPAGVQGVKLLVNRTHALSVSEAWAAEFEWMKASLDVSRSSGAEVFSGFKAGKSRD